MNFGKDRLFRILCFREKTSVFAFTFNPRFILGSRIYDKVLGPVYLSLCLSPNI